MREKDVFMLMAMDELESKWCLSQGVTMHVQYVRLKNYDLGSFCIPPSRATALRKRTSFEQLKNVFPPTGLPPLSI